MWSADLRARARHALCTTALPLLLGGTGVHAATPPPDVQATSLFQLKQDARDGTAYATLPAYTLFSMQQRQLRVARRVDADVVVQSWGRMDGAGRPGDGRFLNGDVSLAFVETRAGPWAGRLGRQLVFDGVARGAHLDGAALTSRAFLRTGATLFAGVPVVPLLQDHRGRFMAGGRLWWRPTYGSEVGVSALHLLEDGRNAAQHVGVDGRLALASRVTLSGMLRWSTLEGATSALVLWPRVAEWREPANLPTTVKQNTTPFRDGRWRLLPLLAEADLQATLQPVDMFLVSLVYRRTSPPLFIPRSSLFSVFSVERRDQFGATLAATPGRHVVLDGDAALLLMPAGLGVQGGARGMLRVGPGLGTTLGAQSRVLRVPSNGYLMGRVFGSQKLMLGIHSTVDADVYLLEKPVHGQRFTTMVVWTNGVRVFPGWDVSAQLAAGASPLATARAEALLRVSYSSGVAFR